MGIHMCTEGHSSKEPYRRRAGTIQSGYAVKRRRPEVFLAKTTKKEERNEK